jgi:hypothetical protein
VWCKLSSLFKDDFFGLELLTLEDLQSVLGSSGARKRQKRSGSRIFDRKLKIKLCFSNGFGDLTIKDY